MFNDLIREVWQRFGCELGICVCEEGGSFVGEGVEVFLLAFHRTTKDLQLDAVKTYQLVGLVDRHSIGIDCAPDDVAIAVRNSKIAVNDPLQRSRKKCTHMRSPSSTAIFKSSHIESMYLSSISVLPAQ